MRVRCERVRVSESGKEKERENGRRKFGARSNQDERRENNYWKKVRGKNGERQDERREWSDTLANSSRLLKADYGDQNWIEVCGGQTVDLVSYTSNNNAREK